MGVDISHIVRHDFHELKDLDKSRAFCENTRDSLWSHLLLSSHIDNEVEDDYNDIEYLDDEIGFELRIPYCDIELDLRDGCWKIESYFHYTQLLMGNYVRNLAFDITRALGQSEAWHAEEYYTWNGGPLEDPKCSFQQWYDFAKNKYGKDIPEFNSLCIGQYDQKQQLRYEPIYHDGFDECLSEYNQLQNKTDKYRLVGLTRIGSHILRAEKDGELFLLHDFDLHPIVYFPVRTEYTFGRWIVAWKDNESAVIDGDGNMLTPFVKGRFEIEQERKKVHRNGFEYYHSLIFAENREAKMKLILCEWFTQL